MNAQSFDFTPLLRADLPPAAAKWNGFPQFNFVGQYFENVCITE